MGTFVLVHGAWHGGWCWRRVAATLRRAGHEVFTPTLTGLGERSHLLVPSVDLSTHILDVVNLFRFEDLADAVLCGHSYGGMVVTGVADAVPERIAELVYLDALVPEDGQAVRDLLPPARIEALEADRRENGEGWRISPVPAANFGVEEAADRAWVDGNCTPQPWASFVEPIRLTGAHREVRRRSYLLAAAYEPSPFHRYAAVARASADWRCGALPTGHDAMVTMPEAVADFLLEALT